MAYGAVALVSFTALFDWLAKLMPHSQPMRDKARENEKHFTVVRSRSPQNLELGYFTFLSCRGGQRNVPKCKTHVQSDCFCSSNLLFCGVVVPVAAVVA